MYFGRDFVALEVFGEQKQSSLLFFKFIFSFLSLFWHESGVMTPFYLSAVVLLFREDLCRKKILYLLPYFLIAFSYLVFRSLLLNINESLSKNLSLFQMNGWEHLAGLFQVFSWYISRLFYPKGIVLQWATEVFHQDIFWNSLGAVSLLLFFLLLCVRFSKEKVCQLAVVWALIGFVPACLAAFRVLDSGVYIEPHWFAFSSIGFFILAAYFCLIMLDRSRKFGLIFLFITIFAWGRLSYDYNQIWADQKTYARFWFQEVPNLESVHFYLAKAYKDEGNFKESRKYYRWLLNDHSSDSDIYNDMGGMDVADGDWKGAELNYRKVLDINPFSAEAYNNLGIVYINQGQREKAKEYFLQALVHDPLMIEPRLNLARTLLKDFEYKQAADLCFKNLDIKKNDAGTLFMLIDIFIREKDLVNMKKYVYQMINHETDPVVLTALAVKMGENNFMDCALDSYTKVMHVAPDYKDAYLNAGVFFAKMGNYDEAIHLWKFGLNIDPSDQRFKNHIAKAIQLKLK
ncbi:MAG: tetratricopeptide repeat protein [Candidatus Omnitrophica bacterium]|nr:tetratricopeptide repeat protein [Candidatus Omnitrophota bacterium]